jgi:hypothetical protein
MQLIEIFDVFGRNDRLKLREISQFSLRESYIYMPSKRVSEKEIVVSSPAVTHRKPATASRAKRSAPKAAAAAPATQSVQTAPTSDQIAALAYSYWEARGFQGGSPEQDWLRAEQELAAKTVLTATASA